MEVKIGNGTVAATFSTKGAELQSAVRDGAEYIWCGDPEIWEERSPVMFPVCGRLPGGKYLWKGVQRSIGLHGFARHSEFAVESKTADSVRFVLRDTPETRERYPFAFSLAIEYRLVGAKIAVAATVANENGPGGDVLPFQVGFHPGFSLPIGGEGDFGDWSVVFDEPCDPDRVEFSEAWLPTGRRYAFPLVGRREIPLSHDMFDEGSMFLCGASRGVALRSRASRRFVHLDASDFPVLGLWQQPCKKAPYLCLEPWAGLPSFDGVEEDFTKKAGMTRLLPLESKTWRLVIELGA